MPSPVIALAQAESAAGRFIEQEPVEEMMSASAAPAPIAAPPTTRKGKFVYLFIAQVLMLVSFPYLDQPGWPLVLFRVLGLAFFLSAIYALGTRRTTRIVGLALALPASVLNALFAIRPEPRYIVPTLLCTIPFLAFTLVSLLRAVVTSERVTSDTIYGAISVYLLMALTWGTAYLLLVTLQPGALRVSVARHPGHVIDWNDCIFYSYVTLTSLGYGDIVPVTQHARSLSILEAVSGIMYVAVLVARLVGLYSASKSRS